MVFLSTLLFSRGGHSAESPASSSSNLAIVPSARAAPVGAIPSLDTSVHVLLFPGIALRRRTVLEAALAGLKTGRQIAISPSGEAVKEATTSAAEDDLETCFHGCNPRCLAEILKSGLLSVQRNQRSHQWQNSVCAMSQMHRRKMIPLPRKSERPQTLPLHGAPLGQYCKMTKTPPCRSQQPFFHAMAMLFG